MQPAIDPSEKPLVLSAMSVLFYTQVLAQHMVQLCLSSFVITDAGSHSTSILQANSMRLAGAVLHSADASEALLVPHRLVLQSVRQLLQRF